jgi:nicotinate-nucleotide pyrophosphorylase (carboxylating)
MRHPALGQLPFQPMTVEQATRFKEVVARALEEDAAATDVTSMATISSDARAVASLVARSGGTIAGLRVAELTFKLADPQITFTASAVDGETVERQTVLATVEGSARSLLAAERVALNLLGRMCGIATLTHAFVRAVQGTQARICDTRKTTPGLRALERYAVRAGGGFNHRFDLSDAVLIKDNHLAAAGSIARAVAAARASAGPSAVVEVECESVEQVREAVEAGADAVLLDNMDLDALRHSVAVAGGRAVTEASGGITLENVTAVAHTGVQLISVGALTHSAPCADVALDFVPAVATAERGR